MKLFKPYTPRPSLPQQNQTTTIFHKQLFHPFLLSLYIWRHHLTHMLARQNGTRVVMTVDVNSHLALSGCGWTTEEAKSAVGSWREPFPLPHTVRWWGESVGAKKKKRRALHDKERRRFGLLQFFFFFLFPFRSDLITQLTRHLPPHVCTREMEPTQTLSC